MTLNFPSDARGAVRAERKRVDLLVRGANPAPALKALTVDGVEWYDSVTGITMRQVGANAVPWRKPWTSFVPAWTGFTVGNGTVTALYRIVEGKVEGDVRVVFGTTTAVGTTPRFSFPVSPHAIVLSSSAALGHGSLRDNSTADVFYMEAMTFPTSVDAIVILRPIQSGAYVQADQGKIVNWSSTSPVATATGDILSMPFEYPVLNAAA